MVEPLGIVFFESTLLDLARGAEPRPKKLTGSAQILDLAHQVLVIQLRPLMAYPLSMPELLFT